MTIIITITTTMIITIMGATITGMTTGTAITTATIITCPRTWAGPSPSGWR